MYAVCVCASLINRSLMPSPSRCLSVPGHAVPASPAAGLRCTQPLYLSARYLTPVCLCLIMSIGCCRPHTWDCGIFHIRFMRNDTRMGVLTLLLTYYSLASLNFSLFTILYFLSPGLIPSAGIPLQKQLEHANQQSGFTDSVSSLGPISTVKIA